jgi:hypothetical protein
LESSALHARLMQASRPSNGAATLP